MSARFPGSPSPRSGAQQAARLRRLVIAVWAASWLAIAPAIVLMACLVAPGLASLPAGPVEAAPGDAQLIVLEAVREAEVPLALALLCGLAVQWAWTVLWHAGIVSWQLWTGGCRTRLGELLGLGLVAWWRYARLSAAALAALAGAAVVVGLPLWWGVEQAYAAMAERRLVVLLVAGAGTGGLAVIVIWLATLHGAWLLGLPERRSAVLAWLAGLRATLRRPLPALWAWLVWVVPALLVSAVVPLLGAAFAGLRGGLLLVVLGLLASLARAFCWVGLFCSFAPVAGLVGVPEGPLEAAAGSTRHDQDREGRRPEQGEPPGEPDVNTAAP